MVLLQLSHHPLHRGPLQYCAAEEYGHLLQEGVRRHVADQGGGYRSWWPALAKPAQEEDPHQGQEPPAQNIWPFCAKAKSMNALYAACLTVFPPLPSLLQHKKLAEGSAYEEVSTSTPYSENDISNSIKNGILYLEDPINHVSMFIIVNGFWMLLKRDALKPILCVVTLPKCSEFSCDKANTSSSLQFHINCIAGSWLNDPLFSVLQRIYFLLPYQATLLRNTWIL